MLHTLDYYFGNNLKPVASGVVNQTSVMLETIKSYPVWLISIFESPALFTIGKLGHKVKGHVCYDSPVSVPPSWIDSVVVWCAVHRLLGISCVLYTYIPLF